MPEPRAPSHRMQSHATRRLHDDLRLEWSGVLTSRAVMRGPSLIAGERRLAVAVEDHGLAYADVEGVVLLRDRGVDPGAASADESLRFTLLGEKFTGRRRLTRMEPSAAAGPVSWLLAASRDAAARRRRDSDIPIERPRSVATGRGIEAIAASAARREA